MGHALTGVEARQLSKEMTKTRSKGKGIRNLAIKSREKPDERETVFVVGYESSKDTMNPHNWSYGPRIMATILIADIGFIVGFASSIDSVALTQAAEKFGQRSDGIFRYWTVPGRVWIRCVIRWTNLRDCGEESSIHRYFDQLYDLDHGFCSCAEYWRSACVSFPG
jgi:hypothetical protein